MHQKKTVCDVKGAAHNDEPTPVAEEELKTHSRRDREQPVKGIELQMDCMDVCIAISNDG